jgi:hypothetical protein
MGRGVLPIQEMNFDLLQRTFIRSFAAAVDAGGTEFFPDENRLLGGSDENCDRQRGQSIPENF